MNLWLALLGFIFSIFCLFYVEIREINDLLNLSQNARIKNLQKEKNYLFVEIGQRKFTHKLGLIE